MLQTSTQHIAPSSKTADARTVYQNMIDAPVDQRNRDQARAFLEEQLALAALLPCDMTKDPKQLLPWTEQRALEVGEAYREYLDARKAGEPRRYFACRSQALSFLQQVAPTKLVDGAWLYGTLEHWRDNRFHPLIRTYLEELGEGESAQNHVLMYQRLLAQTGCDPLPELSNEHYVQGAVQLTLAYHADQFMPEVIGYNLGYEQLPLHLLITAFELNELDIEPYYFSLHVTIDNASTGHAQKAVKSVLDNVPVAGDAADFLQRVANGYRLNDLGLSSVEAIASFDLEHAVIDMLEHKRQFGMHMHSDFCRIGKHTVNEWLSRSGRIPAFLEELQARGWIKRHEDPRNSRFWHLLEGSKARMFGVFSPYETQVLYDWIAGDWLIKEDRHRGVRVREQQVESLPRTFPRRRVKTLPPSAGVPGALEQTEPKNSAELKQLKRELKMLPEELRMQRLIGLMSPSLHASPEGLLATQLFVDQLK